MNNIALQNTILSDAPRIVDAISTGAGWDPWMHVELVLILRNSGLQAARSVPYPPPNSGWTLDVLAQDDAGEYAIELALESEAHFGAAIIAAVDTERQKIGQYPSPNPGARWVVGIGFSQAAVQAMQNFASEGANNAVFAYSDNIGVLVATV